MVANAGKMLTLARLAAGLSLQWKQLENCIRAIYNEFLKFMKFVNVNSLHLPSHNHPTAMVRVLDCIECSGPRTFLRDGFPCVRYTNHYFLTGAIDWIAISWIGLQLFNPSHMSSSTLFYTAWFPGP